MKNLEVVECKESLGRVYAILVDPENGRYVLAKGYDVLTGEWQETTGLTGSIIDAAEWLKRVTTPHYWDRERIKHELAEANNDYLVALQGWSVAKVIAGEIKYLDDPEDIKIRIADFLKQLEKREEKAAKELKKIEKEAEELKRLWEAEDAE